MVQHSLYQRCEREALTFALALVQVWDQQVESNTAWTTPDPIRTMLSHVSRRKVMGK